MARRARSAIGSIIGFVIVGLIAIWLIHAVIGSIFWLIRTIVFIALVGALIYAYLSLKSPPDT